METFATDRYLLRVLVADDIEDSRNHLCKLLRELGHEVISAKNGLQALAAVRDASVDIVFLDLLMPDIDGFEVTRRIRTLQADRWLPVVACSSLEGEELFSHALSHGADDCLSRPVNARLLDARLKLYGRILLMQSSLSGLAQRQRAIHDNILDAVITVNESGRIEEANRAACELFSNGPDKTLSGKRVEELLGIPLVELNDRREIAWVRHDGSQFPLEMVCSRWREGSRVYRTVVLHDLSQQRLVARMKDEFLSMVSHELRTPLTSVVGALGLMASGAAGVLPPASIRLVEVARRNGLRLGRLIDDVLELTKLEAEKMQLNLSAVRLEAALEEVASSLKDHAQRIGVSLVLALPTESLELEVDIDRFLQIMTNLLSNAIKHSPPGSDVTIEVQTKNKSARILVRDQGPGVPSQFRNRIFEKFSQADSSDRRFQGGTGLGLYITKMLTHRMGGTIGVESTPGQGAEFFVEFPLRHVTLEDSGPWALHVDAESESRAHLARWVEPVCRIVSIASLALVSQALTDVPPTIIVADPGSQGRADDFCSTLKQLSPRAKVLLFSDSVDAEFALLVGMSWLSKARTTEAALIGWIRAALVSSK